MKKYVLVGSMLAAVVALSGCSNDDGSIYNEVIVDKEPEKVEETPIDWDAAADIATNTLVNAFWNDRGYFNNQSNVANGDGWNYWPQAHAMDVIIDAFKRTGNEKYSKLFGEWYTGVKHQSGGSYYNDFVDDEEWIALTMLRLYDATGESRYLNTAVDLWNRIKQGWNTEYGGGGLAWKHSMPWSKNACSNSPGSLIACRLYSIRHQEDDLEWAKKIYSWTRANLFNPDTGAIYDNMDGRNGSIATFSLTYNQGTFMGTAHMLYQFTGETKYLTDATRAANYCINKCIDSSTNLLRDEGTGDGELFKGIFMRYFTDLLVEPDLDEDIRARFVNYFNYNAKVVWIRCVADREEAFFGPRWDKAPDGSASLNGQTSGATLLEMKARFDKM